MSRLPTPVGDLWVRRWSDLSSRGVGRPLESSDAIAPARGRHDPRNPSGRPGAGRHLQPLVALHGFSQHGGSFAELAEALAGPLVAPDLPGHGRSRVVPTIPNAVTAVASLLEAVGPPLPLLGYSQGGRIALHVALEHPGLVSRLVLVSASPGIPEVSERAARREWDEAWAHLLDTEGMEAFLDRWLALPLLAGLKDRGAEWCAGDRAGRAGSDPGRLAAALRGMGQGVQAYLGDRLEELGMPVLILVGERDAKYLALGEEMAERIPRARLVMVPGAGHPLVGEAPRAVARAVAQD